MNIVLIETSGNQRFIFATNKLRENVGASELTYRVGTEYVLEAVAQEAKGESLYDPDDLSGSALRDNLLDTSKNPQLGAGGCPVEVITATSGKALLLVADAETGKRIVRAVTEKALRKMPGLTVRGAISEAFGDLQEVSGVHQAITEVHRKLERIRYEMPGNEQRFLRLPFVAPCATSGLPARETILFQPEGEERNRSAVTIAKLRANERYLSEASDHRSGKELKRIEAVIKSAAPQVEFPSHLQDLEEKFKNLSWLAVIHADGNGLGQIFLEFDRWIDKTEEAGERGRAYIDKYRRFSLALDVCTIEAAGRALENLRRRLRAEAERARQVDDDPIPREIPVVPLVLGGDDLTVLCDGRYALKFTQEFLRNFEEETTRDYCKAEDEDEGIVPQIARKAFGVAKLGICAGVAIVKPHFPFHQAYDLAEQLLKSAKQVKERVLRQHEGKDVPHPCSALDYSILYDSTVSHLDQIRARLKADHGSTRLYARPYVVSSNGGEPAANEWLRPRRWSELEKRVAAMTAKDKDGKRRLPNSQLHTLREALFLGHGEADARMKLIRHRYKGEEAEQGFDVLLCDRSGNKPSLFFPEPNEEQAERSTHFLDALDIVEFRKGEKEENGELNDKRPSDEPTAQ